MAVFFLFCRFFCICDIDLQAKTHLIRIVIIFLVNGLKSHNAINNDENYCLMKCSVKYNICVNVNFLNPEIQS